MKKLILVCGPAAIGKSTFCKKYAEEHPDEVIKVISADEIRKEMCGSYKNFPPKKNMKPIYNKIIKIAKKYYYTMDNVTVMLDTTMLYDKLRLFFIRHLWMYKDRHLYLLKLHDYTQCLVRNKMRIEEKWVPEEIIISMYTSYADPTPNVAKKFVTCKEFYVD